MAAAPRSSSQADSLAQTIRERIQHERLADGVFFMTEAQVAEEYGTSRTVTREAVSRLQALGILEGRKRKGLIVRHPDPVRLLSNSLPSLVTSQSDWHDLAQLRYALEVGAIELAIRWGTEPQVAELGEITDALERALKKPDGSRREVALDMEFHAQILKMTGSRLIAGMQQVLVEYFRLSPHSDATPAVSERVSWEHRELFQAIRDRDVERARSMIRLQFRMLLEAAPAGKGESAAHPSAQ